MTTDDIRFILERALTAPSGDNNQPWHWVVRGNVFELWDKSPDDVISSLYSGTHQNGRSSHLVFGMAIENVVLAATTRGYRTEVAYLPDAARPDLAAILTLVKDPGIASDPLASGIDARMTNRMPYHRVALTQDERALILATGTSTEWGETKVVEGRTAVAELAKLGSLNDELIFGIHEMHDYIFSHISWTKKEDERRREGFYFPTLAAPPFSWGAMQVMRHWWFMRIAVAFGVHHLIAFEQRFMYRQTGTYGIVTAKGDTPADWMKVGRLIERLWIAVNAAGLSLHPMNGTILFAGNADTDEGRHIFSSDQRARLKRARARIAAIFGVEDRAIAFMFRIGHAYRNAVRTTRLSFDEKVTIVPLI